MHMATACVGMDTIPFAIAVRKARCPGERCESLSRSQPKPRGIPVLIVARHCARPSLRACRPRATQEKRGRVAARGRTEFALILDGSVLMPLSGRHIQATFFVCLKEIE